MSLTSEQRATRKTRIGASEMGALLSVDPYRTALDVWRSKVLPDAQLPAEEDFQRWGLDVEPAALAFYVRKHGLTLAPAPGTITSKKLPALCATPDGIAVHESGKRTSLESKNSQWHQRGRWGAEEMEDKGAPLLYIAQVVTSVGVARAEGIVDDDAGILIATIGGAPPVGYPIPFDADLFGTLNQLAEKFLRDHVVPMKEPEGWEQDRHALEYVKARWKDHDDKLLPQTEDAIEATKNLRAARAKKSLGAKEEKVWVATLASLIGEHEGIEDLVSYRKCKDSTALVTDYQTVASELALRAGVLKTELEALVQKHTARVVTKKGSRRMRLLGGDTDQPMPEED